MKEAIKMYKAMMAIFSAHEDEEVYDVDMFVHDIELRLFTMSDPQDIEEDDFLNFHLALVLLVRDDLLLRYYGYNGLAILHAELMNSGEGYYVNKEVTR